MTEEVFDQEFVEMASISLLTNVLKIRRTKNALKERGISYNVCASAKLTQRWIVATGKREDLRQAMFFMNSAELLPLKLLSVI